MYKTELLAIYFPIPTLSCLFLALFSLKLFARAVELSVLHSTRLLHSITPPPSSFFLTSLAVLCFVNWQHDHVNATNTLVLTFPLLPWAPLFFSRPVQNRPPRRPKEDCRQSWVYISKRRLSLKEAEADNKDAASFPTTPNCYVVSLSLIMASSRTFPWPQQHTQPHRHTPTHATKKSRLKQ